MEPTAATRRASLLRRLRDASSQVHSWVAKRLTSIAGEAEFRQRVLRRDILVCLLMTGGLFVFWTCQYAFEGEVMSKVVDQAKLDLASALQRGLWLSASSESPARLNSLSAALDKLAESSDTALANWVSDLTHDRAFMGLGIDTIVVGGAASRLARALSEKRQRDGSEFGRLRGRHLIAWTTGALLSLMLGLVAFIVVLATQHARHQDVLEGRYFGAPAPLLIFLLFSTATFLMLWMGWGRAVSDVYWVWGLPYGAVLAGFAGAMDSPILRKEQLWVQWTLAHSSESPTARRCTSWLVSKIDYEKQIQGWVLIVAFALGFSLLLGALQAQAERLTREGLVLYSLEFTVLSIYIWAVGMFGPFFRYGSRARMLQELLRGPLQ